MKTIKIISCVSLVLLVSTTLKAQQVITSAGDFNQNSQYSLSWSLGEVAIETLTSTNYILTQGFQQSLLTVTAIDETKGITLNISIYPNPTSDFVTINLNETNFLDFEYQLISPKGESIEQNKFTSQSLEIPFHNLSSGVYFLKVMNGKDYEKNFKIVKN